VPGLVERWRAEGRRGFRLQWRAGHVPGLVTNARASANDAFLLQWRAGHVPGLVRHTQYATHVARPSFNGGPGTCPAWS